jgi:hypothetical protein
VISYDGKARSMGSLRTELRFLDSDIEGFEHQAAQLLERIGVK